MLNNRFTAQNFLSSICGIWQGYLATNRGFIFWFFSNIGPIILMVPFIFPILGIFFSINLPPEIISLSTVLGILVSPFLAYHIYYGCCKVLEDYSIHFFGSNPKAIKFVLHFLITILIIKTLFYSWTLI